MDKKFRLPRIWSNSELKKISHLFHENVINVSAGENIDKEGSTYDKYFYNALEFWTSNYSPGSFRGFSGQNMELLIDLETDLPNELINNFQVVFNHTTLEHVFNVFKAFENLCKLSKDVVILIVPFAQEQHENSGYLDYWRFTPTCIRKLFEINNYQTIYEAANNDFNTSTYLFFIASKNPQNWLNKMPSYSKIQCAANWIGKECNKKNSIFKNLSRLFKLI